MHNAYLKIPSTVTRTYDNFPFLSIIVPARNEQEHIEKCIRSIMGQSYSKFEVIVLDDDSTDDTLNILKRLREELDNSSHHESLISKKKLQIISLKNKPDNWTGKTWALAQGFIHSQGEIILLTDADTNYVSNDAVALTVDYFLREKLDVMTGISFIKLKDPLSKIVMPLWAIFLITFGRNAAKMNNLNSNEAYLLGAFIMAKREVLRKIGGFESVKNAIQEDKVLGELMKRGGFKVRIVKISDLVESLWSRDASTLWYGIERTLAPVIKESKLQIIKNLTIVFFMSLLPFLILPCLLLIIKSDLIVNSDEIFYLSIFDILLCIIVIFAVAMKCKGKYKINSIYSSLAPIASIFIILSHLNALIKFNRKTRISIPWRTRKVKI